MRGYPQQMKRLQKDGWQSSPKGGVAHEKIHRKNYFCNSFHVCLAHDLCYKSKLAVPGKVNG